MKRRPYVWHERRIARLRVLWELAWGMPQIADDLGVTVQAVKHARKFYGLAPRRNGRPHGRVRKPASLLPKSIEKSHHVASLPQSDIAWPTKQQLMGGR